MAEVKWIKLSTEVFCDTGKITQIEAMPEGDTLVVIWFKLLVLAGKVNDGGAIYLTPEIPYTDEMLANAFRKPINTVRMAMQIFEKFGMIEIVNDILYLSSWEKYQSTDRLAEIREYNRLAKQREREKKKLLEGVNDKSMTSQRCQDIEEEKEEDKEKEKESHSFNRSFAHEENISNKETEYIEAKVSESGLYGKDAEVYRAEVIENLKMRYIGGSLGQGVVFMSTEQFNDLLDKLGLDAVEKYMSIVAECEKNGKRYKKKSHYQAILDMVERDRRIGK